MSNYKKVLLTVLCLVLGYGLITSIGILTTPLPEPDPPCSCAGKQDCLIKHFEVATCAIGPGRQMCCEVRLEKL